MADSVTLPVFQTDTIYEAEEVYIYDNMMGLVTQEGATNGTILTGNVAVTVNAADVTGPARIYEFTLTKPATVYITTSSASTYISGLNAGWTYEFDEAKYALYSPSYDDVTMDDGSRLLLPTGGTRSSDTARGHVYYQHFEAGENIEIPAHTATASSRKLGIFIVWDEVQN